MPGSLDAEARALLARADAAALRARVALATAIDDMFLPEAERLDNRTRAALGATIAAMAGGIEGELVERAGRMLAARGAGVPAGALAGGAPLVERLASAGLLHDADFVGECLARVRLELLAAAMPGEATEGEIPSVLARLAQSSDRVVASAAAGVMIGESQRRGVAESGALVGTGLPAGLHARLLWWVAAALRERAAAVAPDQIAAIDRAITEAALRNLAAHDEGDRLESVAMRLAAAIEAEEQELPALLDEMLRDRRLVMIAAFVAHALGTSFDLARELLTDAARDRLWLVLRALDVPRDVMARIGYQLSEADPRCDADGFADTLDVAMAVDAETARIAVEPLRLHPGYRAAVVALGAAGPLR